LRVVDRVPKKIFLLSEIQYPPRETAQAFVDVSVAHPLFFNFHLHEGHMNDSQAIHKFGQHLSDIQVAFVLAFDKVKVTQQKIASLVHCSRNAVRTALTNYTFETFKGCKPHCNYQRITTEDEDKTIKNTLKHNSFLPLRDITNLLPVKISQTTLRRRRTEFRLGSYVAAKKPGLRPENVEVRLRWALEHINWSISTGVWKTGNASYGLMSRVFGLELTLGGSGSFVHLEKDSI